MRCNLQNREEFDFLWNVSKHLIGGVERELESSQFCQRVKKIGDQFFIYKMENQITCLSYLLGV